MSSLTGTSRVLEGEEIENEQEVVETPPPSSNEISKSRWLLVGSAAIYGSSFPMIKLLNDEIPVGVNLPLRFGLASLLTLPWIFVRYQNPTSKPRQMA